jgi:hypothetical protein
VSAAAAARRGVYQVVDEHESPLCLICMPHAAAQRHDTLNYESNYQDLSGCV